MNKLSNHPFQIAYSRQVQISDTQKNNITVTKVRICSKSKYCLYLLIDFIASIINSLKADYNI